MQTKDFDRSLMRRNGAVIEQALVASRDTSPPTIGRNSRRVALMDAINLLCDDSYGAAFAAGFHHDLDTGELKTHNVGEMLMLITSELAEAMEGDRKNIFDTHLTHRKMIEVEMADAVIRIFDTARTLKLDLAGAYVEKRDYNDHRQDHRVENRRLANGKKY